MQNTNENHLTFQFWQTAKHDLSTLTNIISKKYEDSTSPYEKSIAMLLHAIKGEHDRTLALITQMQNMFESKKSEPDYEAWLHGRMLAALTILDEMHNPNHGYKYAQKMQDIAKHLDKLIGKIGQHKSWVCTVPTLMSAWAIGYLINYNIKIANTEIVKEQLLELNSLINWKVNTGANTNPNSQGDLLWAITMFIYAAANAKNAGIVFKADENYYEKAKDYILQAAPGCKQILPALEKIKETDFRAWAINLVRLSAYLANDAELYDSLETAAEDSIQKAPNDENKALGMAYEIYANEVIQQEVLNTLQFA